MTTTLTATGPTVVRRAVIRAAGLRRHGWRAVLAVFAVCFLLPLGASLAFSLRGPDGSHSLSAWTGLPGQPGFASNLLTSLELAAGTVALTLTLMVPTVTWVHLRLPRWRPVLESVCLLPLVIPPVALAGGVLSAFQDAPQWLTGTPLILALEYTVLALPFTFRALDAGLAALPLPTLIEAARSLGAGWPTTLLRVVVPNLRTAVLSSAVLCAAMVFGEYTLASLLLMNTLPVWTVQVGQQNAQVATAACLLTLLLSWALLGLISLAGNRRAPRTSRSRP
jgi:putative spermidine/putrescine transport system permease protein